MNVFIMVIAIMKYILVVIVTIVDSGTILMKSRVGIIDVFHFILIIKELLFLLVWRFNYMVDVVIFFKIVSNLKMVV